MKKQPIFVIEKSRVEHWINHQSHFTQIPYSLDWGKLTSIEDFLNVLDNEKSDGDYIRMSKLYDLLNKFKTYKLLPNANRMIDRVFAICKTERKDLNEILKNEND
jgi:hypothetical protein